jgi:hypothetical protein
LTEAADNELASLPVPTVHHFRGSPVVLDSEVARFFGVETRRLNEQVKRNSGRFGDFAFALNKEEFVRLKSQSATSSWGGRRKPPTVFTEHGVVMAATVLRSERAAVASRFIVRVFVEARRTSLARTPGINTVPTVSEPQAVLGALGGGDLARQLDAALGRVITALVDSDLGATVQKETAAVAAKGLAALKAKLDQPGLQNEKLSAEIAKLLVEAENHEVTISGQMIDNQHRHLALIAKQLRLIIEMHRYFERGDIDLLLAVLKDIGDAR